MTSQLSYLFDTTLEEGGIREITPSLFWVRMPLPFRLNHINLWLLKDGDGWSIVDTGIDLENVREYWSDILLNFCETTRLEKMIVTHFHPDHVGLAGWFSEKYHAPLWMTLGEWGMARNLKLETQEFSLNALNDFYRQAGFDDDLLALVPERSASYPMRISRPPSGIHRLMDQDNVDINGVSWRVIVASGHSPEHACLYNEKDNILISGDQVLPRISPNISIWPEEPFANPLALFLKTMNVFDDIPKDVLVLPSHDAPFYGLHARLDELRLHHEERLDETYQLCSKPSSALDVLKQMFTRPLDSHQIFFAIGESLAHLHYLFEEGRLQKDISDDGCVYFCQK